MMKRILNKIKGRLIFGLYRLFALIFSSVSVKHLGVEFRMKTSTSNEVHRALTFSNKEPETLNWIDHFHFCVGREAVLFDIGANVGVYSLYAKAKHPSLKVYSFEPEATSFASLCKNIALNKFCGAIPYQIAMSKGGGLGELFVSSLQAGAGAAALGNNYTFTNQVEHPFIQGVCKSSLDLLVNELGLPTPNYLKIDVDGLEQEILYGGKAALSNSALAGLLVEFQYQDEKDLDPIITFLSTCGLSLEERSHWSMEINGIRSQNFIFTRDRH